MQVHITNPQLFHDLRVEADIHRSNILISWYENDQLFHQEWDGEFGQCDFEEQFGFQLK